VPVKYIFENSKMQTWAMLRQTSESIDICEEKQFIPFAPLGLTPQQYIILMIIKISRTPLSLTQMADMVDRHANNITIIIDRMEKNGLVKRVRINGDRRSYRLALTPKGEKYYQTGIRENSHLIKEIFDCLSNEELQTLQDLLEKIRVRVNERYGEKKTITEIKVKRRSFTKLMEEV
jgi:DNA-binding MarR family transcriptional regulator